MSVKWNFSSASCFFFSASKNLIKFTIYTFNMVSSCGVLMVYKCQDRVDGLQVPR